MALCPSRMQHTFRSHALRRAHSTYSRPIKAAKFVDALLRETREPIWRLITALSTPHSPDLPAALSRHGVSVEQYRHWRPLLVESNLPSTVSIMQEHGLIVHPSQTQETRSRGRNAQRHLPSWLVLYLLAFKIRTQDAAFPVAPDLAFSHLPVAPRAVQGPLFIFTLLGLARFNLLVPMHRIIDEFLSTPLDHPQLYFNLLLQALACTPTRSVDTANHVVHVLKRMDARQLKLTPATYEALLNDRFVTLQLTKYLREKMAREGVVPTKEHLEAYLRVFSRNGSIHKAHDYLHDIHAKAPRGEGDADDPLHRANTLFLAAQDDRASAFTFLRSLLASPDSEATFPSSSPAPARIPKHYPTSSVTQRTLPTTDIYTFTSALAVATRDVNLSSASLLSLFTTVSSSTSPSTSSRSSHTVPNIRLAPTTATHTVLIRGLLARKDYALALTAWVAFRRTGLRIDREALSAGMVTLVRAGKAHQAIALLEEYAGSGRTLSVPSNSPTSSSTTQRRRRPYAPLPITSITLNDLLVALNRSGRPDVVFALFDAMSTLYNVHPDARTLSILLQSARLARRLDEGTVRGAVLRIGWEMGLGKRAEVDEETSADANTPITPSTTADTDTHASPPPSGIRVDHRSHLHALLGPPDAAEPHPYKPALWHGTLPWNHALLVFQRALFGAARDPTKLLGVQPPAKALVESVRTPEGNLGPFGFGMGLPPWHARTEDGWKAPALDVLLRRRSVPVLLRRSTDTSAPSPQPDHEYTSYYPAIIPTNEAYFNYILLLGVLGRGAEVAHVLAWMREIGVKPGRQTISAAVVLWREATGRAVLVERWTAGRGDRGSTPVVEQGAEGHEAEEDRNVSPGRERELLRAQRERKLEEWVEEEYNASSGEYRKLVRWLADWVGVWRLPGPKAISDWTRNIARLREGRDGDQEEGGVEEEGESADGEDGENMGEIGEQERQ
ncbi:hypothetical protein DXG03_003952 [Asterophora parasitica]|uniref:Pentatricopeptide repeat protein n=1 Tax=Asterophora parasitica TaxID=117018 RepID=A0A9P7KBL7_9AGAR|nr:hypothetical protein DXG03_003952 [Asterophora parasitica]